MNQEYIKVLMLQQMELFQETARCDDEIQMLQDTSIKNPEKTSIETTPALLVAYQKKIEVLEKTLRCSLKMHAHMFFPEDTYPPVT